ncbi:A/G-specific adenine glycosylase [Arthrobacter castelli]|uniref:A/G-specific adenine glycosylase n=1 Tax=Arthrobacter castelli TaxID=271431 RepID=UPI00047A3107|nr:A/G-specific adenine glycosylase [Arthrobacter castelli]
MKHDNLHQLLDTWFAAHARDLPWRSPDCTPWGIMVSEFMLQQTPVARVLPLWQEWLQRWPRPADLAAEPSGEAVRSWGRLGYPRRALRLHAAAAAIVSEHDGEVPDSFDELLRLPGAGNYTAAAIASFAFGKRETVVDTNIRRVQARAIRGRALPEPALTAAESELARDLLPSDPAAAVRWNASTMELGALVCTAKAPKCGQCPLLGSCRWVAEGRPEPHYQPKGQSWHGTDRQVRGALMAVLRVSDVPVPSGVLLDPAAEHPAAGAGTALRKLHSLQADASQLERALNGLLQDRLAEQTADGVQLPG